jgi:DHA1 family solute carrier family 18 vesicular amine transporter 1/2
MEALFLIIASFGIIGAFLQLLIIEPPIDRIQKEEASLLIIIKDPYIMIAAGAFSIINASIASIETSVPIWLVNTMNAKTWEIAVSFLPMSISYIIAAYIFGRISHKIGRWLCITIGLIVTGISLIIVAYSKKNLELNLLFEFPIVGCPNTHFTIHVHCAGLLIKKRKLF